MKPQTAKRSQFDDTERRRLVALRKQKELGVGELAALIGINEQSLYRLEAGKRRPLKITLRLWREALGT